MFTRLHAGYGEYLLKTPHYAQAVEVGDPIGTSGQGGWDEAFQFPASVEDKIARAFSNAGKTLPWPASAGSMWSTSIVTMWAGLRRE